MTDSTRADALLTSTQREFLRNQGDYYTGEFAKQQRYDRRENIKKRVWNGFLDGTTLLEHTTPDQRRAIFDGWEDFARPESAPGDDERPDYFGDVAKSRGEWIEKLRADAGFSSWIAFLYLGLSESDGIDFEPALRRGIEQAEESRGQVVTDLEFQVDTRERRSIDELKERFERHTRLTTEEIQRLRAAGEFTDDELVAYYDELAGPTPGPEHDEDNS
jgi:hypothetical protein